MSNRKKIKVRRLAQTLKNGSLPQKVKAMEELEKKETLELYGQLNIMKEKK